VSYFGRNVHNNRRQSAIVKVTATHNEAFSEVWTRETRTSQRVKISAVIEKHQLLWVK